MYKGKNLGWCCGYKKGLSTFGKWIVVELSEENKYMLWILPGFAHFF
jgi:dTDP-4-dehydrorhamnose 3,5-epimerase-like enzyme